MAHSCRGARRVWWQGVRSWWPLLAAALMVWVTPAAYAQESTRIVLTPPSTLTDAREAKARAMASASSSRTG